MIKITFIHQNQTHVVDAEAGESLMQIALNHHVPGMLADCGGCLTCGTCHGYIDAAWADKLPQPAEEETLMLDGILHTEPNSRLTCQVLAQPGLDGLVVRLPDSQL